MKLLSVGIPCYNSQDYMEHCVETLLPGGEKVEILIVDDGSKDNTGKIADDLEARYPNIVRAIHQENGGHGEAVNAGLRNATGLFYKVVDSDDWVDENAYQTILAKLEQFAASGDLPDMVISNYVYDKVGVEHKKVIEYHKYLPVDRMFTWDEAKKMPIGTYLLMHSIIYRTQTLRESGLVLPKHTFYVDNLFVFQPLPSVKKLYYIDVDFYHYFIGRDDQSVHEEVMKKRIDQQLRVNRLMIDAMAGKKIENPNVWVYMRNYLDIICTVSSLLLIRIGTQEAFKTKDELWEYLKNADAELYKSIRGGFLGWGVNLPGPVGRGLVVLVYKVAQKIYGFN